MEKTDKEVIIYDEHAQQQTQKNRFRGNRDYSGGSHGNSYSGGISAVII